MTKIRTRFAPSPTGRMHVGNLRTALYAYLITKHEGGDFILRIEDTDQERLVEGAVDIIYRTLEKTGLVHDEGPDKDKGFGPYVQSERQAQGIYLKYAKQLIEKGEAYYCFCDKERLESLHQVITMADGSTKEINVYDKHCLHLSKEEVEANLAAGKPYVIRQNVPREGTTTFHDELYGDITVNNEELDDMILIKSDGYPTYNFANVVDDHLMEITHVVRGNEYLSSSPKYNRLYDAFGWEVPKYIHCPLITDENHQKLSKRCGHSSYEDLVDQGFLTEAIVNFVALLGWSPVGNEEIFSLDELIKVFDYHHISKSQIVDRQRCIRLIVVDRAGPQRVICEIRERIGCKIQRRLSAVDAAERRVQRHRLKSVRPVRAHRLGQPLRRGQNRLLPPVDVRPVIAPQRQHIRQADGLCIVHTVREFLYKLFVIKRRIAVLFRQKVIFVWDCREINFRVRPLQIPLIDKAEPRQRMFH